MTRREIGGFAEGADVAAYEEIYERGLAALPVPAETGDVATAFGRVRLYRFGEGGEGEKPIVLLHGRAATSIMWLPNLPGLARRRVYALDLLGEGGRSVQTAPIRDGADQAAWLDTVLAEIGTAHLVGLSIGGWLACNQAVRAPERLASVTLLDPAATLAPLPLGAILRTIPVMLPFTADRALPGFMEWVGGEKFDADDPVAQVIMATLRDYKTALPAPRLFTDEQLRSLSVPALVVVGGRSVIHDPRRALERARALIPGVRAELWPDATHSIAGQFADEVDAKLLEFVDEVE